MFVNGVRSFLSDSIAFSTASRQAEALAEEVSTQKKKFAGQKIMSERAAQAAATLRSLSQDLTALYERYDISKAFNLSDAVQSHNPLVEATENILRKMNRAVDETVKAAGKHMKKLGLNAMNTG